LCSFEKVFIVCFETSISLIVFRFKMWFFVLSKRDGFSRFKKEVWSYEYLLKVI